MANTQSKRASAKKVQAKSQRPPITDKLQELSPEAPLPFEGNIGFNFVSADSPYLSFLGKNDNYGHLLLQARLLSTTHNACITTKKNYCAGDGFQNKEEKDITDQKFLDWLDGLNVRGENVTEINKQIFESLFTFGNVPIELCRFSIAGERYFYVYVHNFLEWRLAREDQDDGYSKSALQSKLFLRQEDFNRTYTMEELKNSKHLPLYNPENGNKKARIYRDGINWIVDSNGVERTMIWYKNSVAGFTNYGLPSAASSLINQILEYKAARYNLDNFENNMVLSAVLALKGNLTQGEANRIGKKIIQTHTGDGKRGRVAVVSSEEGIDGSDFHNFDTSKDGSFIESDDKWMQKIILANEWDSVLAGIFSQTSLGKGMGFLTKILEIKKNTVIVPAQRDLMEKVWETIIDIAKPWMKFKVNSADLQIKNTIDISGLTDVDITPAVKLDEVREAKGLPALEDKAKGQMLLGEMKASQMKGVYVKDTGGSSNPNPNPNSGQ